MSHLKVSTFRVALFAAAVAVVMVSVPLTPASATSRAPSAVGGSTLGGTTGQGFPVIVDVNASKSRVLRVLTVVRMNCQPSGATFTTGDGFRRLTVTHAGRFHAAFGPFTQRNPDGTTTDFSGRMTGRFTNAARTKAAGTWQLSAVDHDAAGAVTDSCASPTLSWHAKQ
jgi:hypothetical protein